VAGLLPHGPLFVAAGQQFAAVQAHGAFQQGNALRVAGRPGGSRDQAVELGHIGADGGGVQPHVLPVGDEHAAGGDARRLDLAPSEESALLRFARPTSISASGQNSSIRRSRAWFWSRCSARYASRWAAFVRAEPGDSPVLLHQAHLAEEFDTAAGIHGGLVVSPVVGALLGKGSEAIQKFFP
jgi:hypothetical protein